MAARCPDLGDQLRLDGKTARGSAGGGLPGVHLLAAYATGAAANNLEGYERLILLAMIGDQAMFTSSEGIERLWAISEPLLENPPPVEAYPRGSWGPASVNRLTAPYRWDLS